MPDAGSPLPHADGGPNDAASDAAEGADAAVDAGADASAPEDAGAVDASEPLRHPLCTAALPRTLPESPGEDAGVGEPPAASCDGADEPLACDRDTVCTDGGERYTRCVKENLEANGYCDLAAGEHVALAHVNGACVTMVAPEFKRALCCAKKPGFDCREYEAAPRRAARPGELCRVHDECEPGLLCRMPEDARWGAATGRCVCPGVDIELIRDPNACTDHQPPARWGKSSTPLASACVPARSEGWVVERVAEYVTDVFGAAADSQGRIHLAFHYSELVHALRDGESWTFSDEFPGAYGGAMALALDAEDHPHVYLTSVFGEQPIYGTNRTGEWRFHRFGEPNFAALNKLWIDASGAPHVAYFDLDVRYRPPDLGAAEELVYEGNTDGLAFLELAGELTFIYDDAVFINRARRVAANQYEREQLFDGVAPDAVVDPSGALLIAYTTGASNVKFARVDGSDISEHEVWRKENEYFMELRPLFSLAVAPDGVAYIAHTTPAGLEIEKREGDTWQRTHLADELTKPVLVVDSYGEPHVFYAVDQEIRHAHRGACPP